jgi:hypothetical protein
MQACTSAAASDTPLDVSRAVVTVNGGEVDPGDVTNVEPGDRIEVSAGGLANLRFEDVAQFEMFKGANLTVPDLEADPGFVLVQLSGGHLYVESDPKSDTQIEVDVGNRKVRSAEPGTDFVICQAPDGTTCVFVVEGSVEWVEDDDDVLPLTTGQSTFARAGEPPLSPNCPPKVAFERWRADAREEADSETLGALVDRYRAELCPETPPTTTTSTSEITTTTTTVDTEEQEKETTTSTSGITTTTTTVGGEGLGTDVGLPMGTGMAFVSVQEPQIGTELSADRPGVYREVQILDSPVSFHIDKRATTNFDFRSWLATEAGNDAERWRDVAPNSWFETAPGGAATQATYPLGEEDLSVRGISAQAAIGYCASLGKRIPTEIEWELATVGGHRADFDAHRQDWVSDWDEYGPGVPSGKRVLRGTDATVQPDAYYRLILADTPEAVVARENAGIRCAATTVEPGSSARAVESDQFTDKSGQWPEQETEDLLIGYHPPDVYHLQASRQHAQIIVTRNPSAAFDGGATIKTEVFTEKTDGVEGNYRYGLAFGSDDDGSLLFTVQPNESEEELDWCLEPIPDELRMSVTQSAEGYAAYLPGPEEDRHDGETCKRGLDSGSVQIDAVKGPASLTVVSADDAVTVSINDELVGSVESTIELQTYGFFVETFHVGLAHIHYEYLTVTTP